MSNKSVPNPCTDCGEYCTTCVDKQKHKEMNPYPLPVREEKEEHYNSYLRWVKRHMPAIRHYSARYYEKADQDAEIQWLLAHPKVAYQLVNSMQVPNNVKLARIIYRLVDPRDFYMSSMWIGRPGMGKTWGSLWAAENVYQRFPDKNYCYMSYTKEIHLPPWMEAITSIPEIPNDCLLIVDEGGIQAPSKRAMRTDNLTLGQLLNIRRHKDLQIHFIVQEPEDLDRSIRRQMDYFFLKPYSLTSVESKLLKRLYSFVPSGKNPHSLGFYDSSEDMGMQCWQPAPLSPAREKFSKTYENVDITRKTDLMGEPEEEEEESETVECLRCGYEWEPRGSTPPARCPKCSSRRWDQEPEEDDGD